jgi:nucleoside-diphosphate-sugar epimerase
MRLFAFGLGYTALALIRGHRERFSSVSGTVTGAAKAERLKDDGIPAFVFGEGGADPGIPAALEEADGLLVSTPPDEAGDPGLRAYAPLIAGAPRLSWIGYLSTIGVYGDRQGEWVDEGSPCTPSNPRSQQRLEAEKGWQALGDDAGVPVHVFRLAGIYGPGRNPLAALAAGTARRIVKPGQVFNRIHVDDIAAVLAASLAKPRAGAVYNVADDEPAPPQDVVAFAASLAGVAPPPEEPFAEAALSPMAARFYAESKRASNRLIKEELGVRLAYPTYREGLRALRLAGEGPQAA